MTMLDNEQYERVARWLDGEKLQLTPAEQQAADEIRRDEAQLYAVLEAEAPRAALRRARRRVIAAAARPTKRLWRAAAISAAAAAAAVVLALLPWRPVPKPQPRPSGLTVQRDTGPEESDFAFLAALKTAGQPDEIDVLELECDDIAAALAGAVPAAPLELQIDSLDESFEEIYMYDLPTFPAEG